MPFYDLKCKQCDTEHNIMASMRDKEEKLIPCPVCGSTDMETVYKGAPFVLKGLSDPVAACPHQHICGAACPHGASA
jgi:putative regulatory protein, FmdB family